MEIKKNLI